MTGKKMVFIFLGIVLFPITVLCFLIALTESIYYKYFFKKKPEEYLK